MAKTCTWNEHKKMGKKTKSMCVCELTFKCLKQNNKAHWAMRCHFSLVV